MRRRILVETAAAVPVIWRVSENRVLVPFAQDHHALDEVAFTPFADGSPVTDQTIYYIPEGFDRTDFKPHLVLRVTKSQLEENTGFSANDLRLNLTVRDHGTKNYRCVRSWPLDQIPRGYEFSTDDIYGLSVRQKLTFCVLVTVPSDLPRKFNRPHYAASILAEKRFHIQKEPEAPRFPIEVQPPGFFEKRGLPGDTLWAIDIGADVNEAPEVAVTIYLNQIAVTKLNKAFSGNVAGGLLKNQMSSEIFAEICQRVLAADFNEPVAEEGLVGRVLSALTTFEKSVHELKRMAKEPAGWRLRCYVQSHLKLVNSINRADLRRPWQR